MSKAIDDVVAERQRQIEVEGWTAEHDDAHGIGELSAAGMCYAGHACLTLRDKGGDTVPRPWPWADEWWKPKGPRRDLVRAAALIIAEIDRIDRNSIVAQPIESPYCTCNGEESADEEELFANKCKCCGGQLV